MKICKPWALVAVWVVAIFFIVSERALSSPPSLYDQSTSQYLGNLSGDRDDRNSTSNPYGRYGSKYSPESINNPYGRYGSRYSNDSPTNPYATNPPAIIHNH